MGQKSSSISLRLGYNNNWISNYIEKNLEESTVFVTQDLEIRKYLIQFFKLHGLILHNCNINRYNDTLLLTISYFTNKNVCKYLKIPKKKYNNYINFLKLNNKFLYKKLFVNKSLTNKQKFIYKVISSVYLFLNKKYNIKVILNNINKGLSFRLTNEESKQFRKKLIILRNYFRYNFFSETLYILLLCVIKKKSAFIFTNYISVRLSSLKKHNYFLTFLKRALKIVISLKCSRIEGLKLKISGRFNGAARARTRLILLNKVPLQTLDCKIDYHESTAFTNNGTFGVKVWFSEKL